MTKSRSKDRASEAKVDRHHQHSSFYPLIGPTNDRKEPNWSDTTRVVTNFSRQQATVTPTGDRCHGRTEQIGA